MEGQRRLFINEYPRNEHNIRRTVEDLYRGSMDRAKNIPDTTERNFRVLDPCAESYTVSTLFDRAEDRVDDTGKGSGELEANVTTVDGETDLLADWADEPELSHAEDGTHDTEGDGADGGESTGELVGLVVAVQVVVRPLALAEDPVLFKHDDEVDRELEDDRSDGMSE